MWILNEVYNLCNSSKKALIYKDTSMTFADIYNYSESIAAYIEDKFGTNKKPILIYGNKDNDIIPCMLACLKTGRAYIPIDITTPKSRVLRIFNDANCEFIFDFGCLNLDGNEALSISPELLSQIKCDYKDAKSCKDNWVKPNDTCYIIFTSGSTGIPKGVPITRRNLESMTTWFHKACETSDGKDIVLNQPSYSFDLSVINTYVYLPMGKTLYSIDKETVENPRALFEEFAKSDLGAFVATPSFVDMCCFYDDFSSKLLPNLEKFIFVGEALTKSLVAKLNERFNNPCIINGYGPTEATVLVNYCVIDNNMMESKENLPAGEIFDNCVFKVVDENQNEVPDGEIGELVLIGESVSNGYVNNPEELEKCFFKTKNGLNGYYTGDLVYKKDNMLYYVSRKNFQIKLNGFRVELEDIQSNINTLDYIDNCIVLPKYDSGKISSVVAFVTLYEKTNLSNLRFGMKVKNDLKEILPSYMMPKKFTILDKFPLNPNGKIDRKKLMEGLS